MPGFLELGSLRCSAPAPQCDSVMRSAGANRRSTFFILHLAYGSGFLAGMVEFLLLGRKR